MLPQLNVNSVFYYTRWGNFKVLEYRLIPDFCGNSFPCPFPSLISEDEGQTLASGSPTIRERSAALHRVCQTLPGWAEEGKILPGEPLKFLQKHLFFQKIKIFQKFSTCALSENFIPCCTRRSQMLWDRLLEGYVETLNFALAFYFGNYICHNCSWHTKLAATGTFQSYILIYT